MKIVLGTLQDIPDNWQYDTILYIDVLYIDVLEHIEDDLAEMAKAADLQLRGAI